MQVTHKSVTCNGTVQSTYFQADKRFQAKILGSTGFAIEANINWLHCKKNVTKFDGISSLFKFFNGRILGIDDIVMGCSPACRFLKVPHYTSEAVVGQTTVHIQVPCQNYHPEDSWLANGWQDSSKLDYFCWSKKCNKGWKSSCFCNWNCYLQWRNSAATSGDLFLIFKTGYVISVGGQSQTGNFQSQEPFLFSSRSLNYRDVKLTGNTLN